MPDVNKISPPKQLSYEVLGTQKNNPKEKVEIIATENDKFFGLRYKDANGDLSNYENISIYTYSDKNGVLTKNNDEKYLDAVSNLTKEYYVFGEQRSLAINEPSIFLKDREGFSFTIRNNKGLLEYINTQLASSANNTSIKPAEPGFINAENNSEYLLKNGENLFTKSEKPIFLQPNKENKNKIEPLKDKIIPDENFFFFNVETE